MNNTLLLRVSALPRRPADCPFFPNCSPVTRATWGDAIYCVFLRAEDAATFALLLTDLVLRIPWYKLGLPRSLNIRVSLHAAPVHPVVDPVTSTKNFTGIHTSRAARIEPITAPGSIYCTQAFAAISETLGVKEYTVSYVGNVPLAKSYGLQPVYHVTWAPALSSQRFQQLLSRRKRVLGPFLPSSPEGAIAIRSTEEGDAKEGVLLKAGPGGGK
jgi:hypothetical protein